jgi:hypothetical protein
VSGIGLVAFVLSCFGAEPLIARDGWIAPAIILGSFPASLVLTRDWRTAIALGFSLAVICLMGLWVGVLQKNAGAHFDAVGLYEALAISFALMIGVAASDLAAQESSAILAHAVEQRAALVICAAVSVLTAELASARASLVIAVVVVAGASCSLLLVTAVASALEAVLPRRKSLSELYRRRF